jgi:HD-GYP domain-containing protein (c-di-GMP phosphodiesterase class II)
LSITAMQRSLEKAVARASLADDRDLAGRLRDEGQRLVFLLNGLVRSSRLYQTGNAAIDGLATETSQMLKRLLALLGAVHIVMVEDQIYVNEVRIRMKDREQELLDQLVLELARHEVGGLSFHRPLEPEDIKTIGRALAATAAEAGQARAALGARLSGLPGVELGGRYRFRLKGEKLAARTDAGEVLRRGATLVQDTLAQLAGDRVPHPLSIRRVVIDLVDTLGDTPSRAAIMPLRRSVHGVGTQHLLSVTTLALQLGRAVGLSDGALSDLGVAAMLHDVGYTRSDRSGHEVAGARMLLRQRGFHEGKIRRLQATLEHHLPAEGRPCLFARILRIVDDYDVLVAPRPGAPQLPPPTAQAAMWAARGTLYDPDLLALFVRMMGLYPPGSLLELSDGRWVVSLSGGRDAERFAWPVARLIRDKDGRPWEGVEDMDLFVLREFLRPKRVLNAVTQGVDVGAMLDGVASARS